ncbi:MAG: hypothetical protein IPP44_25970 [Ideonella sp.]|nr:hypothetical protein [Ideonella sp.]
MIDPAHRRFIATQQLVPALVNAALNGWIAWAMHREAVGLALWGGSGYASDLLVTGALLPGITWLILRPLLRHQALAGKAPVTRGVPVPWLSHLMPATLWAGLAVIALLGTGIGLMCCVAAQLAGAPAIAGTDYAWVKGLYGGLLPWLLQPAMVFAALRGAANQSEASK